MSEVSNGVPDVMYFLPNRSGKENRRSKIEDADLLLSREFISEPPYYVCSNEFAELACIIINELQIDMPKDKESAEQLYFLVNTTLNNEFALMLLLLHRGVLRNFELNLN